MKTVKEEKIEAMIKSYRGKAVPSKVGAKMYRWYMILVEALELLLEKEKGVKQ